MNNEFRCPRCNSENIQSCQVIYQSGISSSNAATLADKFIAVTKGVNMTALASSVAPPEKKKEDWTWSIICIFVTYMFFDMENFFLFFIFLCITGFLIKSNIDIQNYNEKIYPELYETWQHSFFCHRCGNIFVMR